MNRSHSRRLTSNLTIALSLAGLFALPNTAFAHNILFDESQYDQSEFSVDYRQCEAMLDNVGNNQGAGAVEQGVKRGARGAAAGAAAGSISGNSGSEAAKKGAAIGTTVGILSGRGSKNAAASQNQKERDDLMRNCMSGRGYQSLN
ncbi:glycine zipper family protein [Vibrio sp. qd031]|uniref:glycine zipper family protein n=1 Tax=Vibrio sp. qd031 TaxID=1603038 RepID=UPI000A112FB8|nr:glycine zipper family protein [Vibrio sp. qd031]